MSTKYVELKDSGCHSIVAASEVFLASLGACMRFGG